MIMKNIKVTFIIKLITFCIFMLILLISIGEILILRDFDHEEAIVHDSLQNSGTLLAQEIQRNISNGIFATETLNTLLLINNFDTSNFDNWGHRIVRISSVASTVELAPDGIVSYIYPLEGNEGAIGHNLLKDEKRNKGALKAIQSRKLTFIGPVKLIQNGKYAVIARKPIFIEKYGAENFWGFTIALLHVDDILPDSISLLEQKGVFLQLEGDNPDTKETSILFKSKNWNGDDYISIKIEVPNGEWILKMNHTPLPTTHHNIFRIIIFLTASAFVSYIFIQQYRMHLRRKEIILLNKKLTNLSLEDELTGVGNRRALMHFLEKQVQQAKRYSQNLSVAMIDLDFFKKINDIYGHPVGDLFLKHVTFCFTETIRKSDYVFRLGGDEFFLMFPNINLQQCLYAIKNIFRFSKKTPFIFEDKEIPISLSIGLTQLYDDDSLESLLNRADKRLYEAKESGRNTVKY